MHERSAQFHTGLDWSEDPDGSWTVIAMVHIARDDLELLDGAFRVGRRSIGRNDDHVFKHVSARANAHEVVYEALRSVPSLHAHVLRFDRRSWSPRCPRPQRGDHSICDAIITLAMACPERVVAEQLLFLDYPRGEKDIVDAFRTVLRGEFRAARLSAFKDVRPRPDSRRDGAIIQAADMIAGEVREQSGVGGLYLPRLGNKLRLI